MEAAAIETIELTKIYNRGKENETAALRGVDLTVRRGEFVALMGTSGSGKSTLLHIIGGLDSVSGGRVLLDGKNITQCSEKELTRLRRNKVGFVHQKFCLVDELSVRENILMPVLFDGKAVDYPYIEDICRILKIEDRLDYFPGQLSGGQQQRTAIARALANKADLLLCDEPTGNLDAETSREVMELISRVHKEYGKTILMVTHDERIADYADRRLYIEDGRINEERFA